MFAKFHGVNTFTVASFKLLCDDTAHEVGRDVYNWFSEAGVHQLQHISVSSLSKLPFIYALIYYMDILILSQSCLMRINVMIHNCLKLVIIIVISIKES